MKKNEQTRVLFTELVERLLSQKLQTFVGKSSGTVTISGVYSLISDTLMGIFKQCDFDLSERAKNYIIEGYFGMIEINGKERAFAELDMANRTSANSLTRSELDLLRWLLLGHDKHDEIEQEYLRRSSVC